MAEPPASAETPVDLLAPEVSQWQYAEERVRGVLEAFAYRELRTPLVGRTSLPRHAPGGVIPESEQAPITFTTAEGDSLSMRVDGITPAVRAYLSCSLERREPVARWYYLGPMFRRGGASPGQLIQHHEIGAVLFGAPGSSAEAEMIAMAVALFGELGLEPSRLAIALNTVGEPEETSKRNFEATRGLLAALGVPSVHDPRLLPILDRQSGLVFEIRAEVAALGSRNRLCAGGRYDRLVEAQGGPPTSALAFALSLERTIRAMSEPAESFHVPPALFIAPLDESARIWALPIAHALRMAGIRVELEHRDVAADKQRERARSMRARLVLVVGQAELQSGTLALEDLTTGQRHAVTEADLQRRLQALLD